MYPLGPVISCVHGAADRGSSCWGWAIYGFDWLTSWASELKDSEVKKNTQKIRKENDIVERSKKGERKEAGQVGGREIFLPTGNTSFKARVLGPEVPIGFCV